MTLDAMRALLADMETGAAKATVGLAQLEDEDWIAWGKDANEAFHGDMNAALALHGALLPGWDVTIRIDSDPNASAWADTGAAIDKQVCAYAPTPARALLIATLRGKIAQMEQEV